jgi:hypothetical protein
VVSNFCYKKNLVTSLESHITSPTRATSLHSQKSIEKKKLFLFNRQFFHSAYLPLISF